MNENVIPVEAVHERDIDLILLEELSTNNTFCEWFIRELNLPYFSKRNGVWKSISDYGLGESDILFSYNSKNLKIFVLIENKIDATFQEEQYNRYFLRAKKYISENECDSAFVILVAPKSYYETQNYFENYITYEAISSRFHFINTERSLFKKKLLDIAIEKQRRGYHPVNSETVQKFWLAYWKYVKEKHPTLYMKKPDIVPYYSDWPKLYDKRLPKNIVFTHKLAQGNVDATFQGYPEEIEFRIKSNAPDWAEFVRHAKTFSLRVFSGKIHRTKDFEKQIKKVEKGLKNIERLRDWILQNQHLLNL